LRETYVKHSKQRDDKRLFKMFNKYVNESSESTIDMFSFTRCFSNLHDEFNKCTSKAQSFM